MSVSGGHRAGWEGPWSQLQATFSPVGDGTRKLGILPPCWTPGWAWGPPTHTPQGSLVPSVQPHSSPDRFPPPALPAGAWPPRTLPGMQDGACRWYCQVLVHQRAPQTPTLLFPGASGVESRLHPICKAGQGWRLSEAGPAAAPDGAEQSLSPWGQPSPGAPRAQAELLAGTAVGLRWPRSTDVARPLQA